MGRKRLWAIPLHAIGNLMMLARWLHPSLERFMQWIVLALAMGGLIDRVASSQEILSWPANEETKKAVVDASEWLVRHVRTGEWQVAEKSFPISVVAWKDPTLDPENPKRLAGYAITDTLWASYSLSLTHPVLAKELRDALERMGCASNSLHEVIWQKTNAIHHKPIDTDLVHGRSLGVLSVGDESIDIRSFTWVEDGDYAFGHPRLFAEHAVYQSLFEFRNGQRAEAMQRIRQIFRSEALGRDSSIHWDAKNGLLIDLVNEAEFQKYVAKDSDRCRQYSFKLATLLYASRLMGLEGEFPAEIDALHQRLMAARLSTGGVAHFFDVSSAGKSVQPCPDATGEATAIFVLAETVQPH